MVHQINDWSHWPLLCSHPAQYPLPSPVPEFRSAMPAPPMVHFSSEAPAVHSMAPRTPLIPQPGLSPKPHSPSGLPVNDLASLQVERGEDRASYLSMKVVFLQKKKKRSGFEMRLGFLKLKQLNNYPKFSTPEGPIWFYLCLLYLCFHWIKQQPARFSPAQGRCSECFVQAPFLTGLKLGFIPEMPKEIYRLLQNIDFPAL